MLYNKCTYHPASSHADHPDLQALAVGIAKGQEAKCRQNAEHDWHGFPEPDGARDGRAAEDDGSQQAQLNTVGLAVLDSVASEGVYRLSACASCELPRKPEVWWNVQREAGSCRRGLTQETD